MTTMEDELAIELCMRGYHVYSNATAGEELLCEREPRDSNCYALRLAVEKYFARLISVLTSHLQIARDHNGMLN